ncbi:MAG: hypothetical protein P4L59_02785, partial [Desulfosporosinus sp.]|nr:hypothetical protein [Desulfosporosinus sp.]
ICVICVICGSPFRIPQGVFTVFFLVGIKKMRDFRLKRTEASVLFIILVPSCNHSTLPSRHLTVHGGV